MNKSGIQAQLATDAFKQMVRATWPYTLKILDGARDVGLVTEWAAQRRQRGGGLLMLRLVTPDSVRIDELPELTDRALVAFSGWQVFAEGGVTVVLELPINEKFHTDEKDFADLAEASVPQAEKVHRAGFVAGVLVTSEGNPPGPDSGIAFFTQPRVLAALRRFRELGSVWAPHGYSHPPAKADDPDHFNRPPRILAQLPEDARLNYAFGEMGCDGGCALPDQKPGVGYKGYFADPAARGYASWVRPQVTALAADELCIGGALFLSGHDPAGRPNFETFDVGDEVDFRPVLTDDAAGPPVRWLTPVLTAPAPENGEEPSNPTTTPEPATPRPADPPETHSPRGGPVLDHPWLGKHAIVWEIWKHPLADLVALGQQLGLRGFCVKVGNGGASWVEGTTPRARTIRKRIADLQAAGFVVTGWVYLYADRAGERFHPDDGQPEMEGGMTVRAVQLCKLSGIVLDYEIEAEGHPTEVEMELRQVKESAGVPVGVFTWGDDAGHETYPWRQIVDGADVLIPMIYQPVWSAAGTVASIGNYLAERAWVPAWGVTEGSLAAIKGDIKVADGLKLGGELYWEAAALRARAAELAPLLAKRLNVKALDTGVLEAQLWAPAWKLEQRAYELDRPDLAAALHDAFVEDKRRAGVQ